jgi:autotransporter-associated beta strand protein
MRVDGRAGICLYGEGRGEVLYWDANGAEPGFGAAGGTWGNDAYWSDDGDGLSAPATTDTTEEDDLFFGTDIHGLAEGTVTVEGAGQAFRSLSFGAASGPVTLSGGTLGLAAPCSRVAVHNASNVIAAALAGPNGLRKFVFPPLAYTNFLTTAPATVFTNALLSDYVCAGAVMHGGSIPKIPANAYHRFHGGASAACQFQALDGGYVKCVKVALTQAGEDVEAQIVYAKYASVNDASLGFDFDSGGTMYDVATATNASGYGIAQLLLIPDPLSSEPFLTSSPTVIAANASLAAVSDIAATLAGGSITGGSTDALPYYFRNDGATAAVQFQTYNGGHTKCAKIELTQEGADIAARVVYAKYLLSQNNPGFDFDQGGATGSIATSFAVGGYGICQLRLRAESRLVLTGANTFSGELTVDGGTLELGGSGRLGEGGNYAGMIANSGTLLFGSGSDQILNGNISGSGSLVKQSPPKAQAALSHTNFLPVSPSALFTNAFLAECTGISGRLGGAAITSGSADAVPHHFRNDGATVTVQLQAYNGGHTKCVKVEFTQSGMNIAARVVYAKYILNENALGFDFDTGGTSQTIATSGTASGYGAAETTLAFYRYSLLTLGGTNSYTGGTVVHRGTLMAAGPTNAFALPATGGIAVNDDGNLVLSAGPLASGNPGGVGNGNPIRVNSGGKLTLAAFFNTGYSRPITLDGGTLDSIVTQYGDNGNYINNLTLMNGARVIGHKVRVGFQSAASITVSGHTPSILEAGLNLVNAQNHPLTLAVADVTGDAGVDLAIPGVIQDYYTASETNYKGMPIVKTGAGTVSLSGVNTCTGRVTLTEGTLLLATNGALNAENAITLNGGTLDAGAFSNTAGVLTLSADSEIVLGEGALAFADSSGAAWTEGRTLTLTGTLGGQTLRFGTGSSALTGGQLAAITLNGKRVRLKPDGYLTDTPAGTLISVQ